MHANSVTYGLRLVQRVTGWKPEGAAKDGFIHLINAEANHGADQVCRPSYWNAFGMVSAARPQGRAFDPFQSEHPAKRRMRKVATVVISQCSFATWHEVLGEPTIADAICDRLFYHAEKLELKGESLRRQPTDQLELSSLMRSIIQEEQPPSGY